MQPAKKNAIVLRIENIADKFDLDAQTFRVTMSELCTDLYEVSNAGDASKLKDVHITEVTLTMNQDYKTMDAKKLRWRTVDDAKIDPTQPLDRSEDEPSF